MGFLDEAGFKRYTNGINPKINKLSESVTEISDIVFTDEHIENTSAQVVTGKILNVLTNQEYTISSGKYLLCTDIPQNAKYIDFRGMAYSAVDSFPAVSFWHDDVLISVFGEAGIKYGKTRLEIPRGTTKIVVNGGGSASELVIETSGYPRLEYIVYSNVKEELEKNQEKLPLFGKTIVNFGDSIFGNKRPPEDISTELARITGATVYNLGFGGSNMGWASDANFDAFSMYRLADAIATRDFSLQDAVDVPSVSNMPSYYAETRTLLKSIDFNNVDIITIAHGTNDFTAGRYLDDKDRTNMRVFANALRYVIETILSAYPHLKIFVCGQTYRFWMSSGEFAYDSDTYENSRGYKLTDMVEKTREVAKEYKLKFIDNYFDLGINKYNRTHWFPSNDGTHHNHFGAVLIAEHMKSEIF